MAAPHGDAGGASRRAPGGPAIALVAALVLAVAAGVATMVLRDGGRVDLAGSSEVAGEAGEAAAPWWPLRLRADVRLSAPAATGALLTIEMGGSGWSDWLAVTAHGPADTDVAVTISATDHPGGFGEGWWYSADEPYTLLDDAAEVVGDTRPGPGEWNDVWFPWWLETRAVATPHPVPHELLRPWAATVAGVGAAAGEHPIAEVIEPAEPDAGWSQRADEVAARLGLDRADLGVRSWRTWTADDCPDVPADCVVTITVVSLTSADVPLLVDVRSPGGWNGELEVTHLDAAGGDERTAAGSDPTPGAAEVDSETATGEDQDAVDAVALLGLWEVLDAGEEDGTVVRLGLRSLDLYRSCGSVGGAWNADGAGGFLADQGAFSRDCGPDPWPAWLAQAWGHRPAGDGHELLDEDGRVLASLVPRTGRRLLGGMPVSLAEAPVVDDRARQTLGPVAPLPDGMQPVDVEDLIGRWMPDDALASRADLRFADGTWTASDGCNGTGGRWRPGPDGTLLVAGDGMSTADGCENITSPYQVLAAARAGLDGEGLVLLDRRGRRLAKFARSDCQPADHGPTQPPAGSFTTVEDAAASIVELPAGGTLEERSREVGRPDTAARVELGWVTGAGLTHVIYLERADADRWSVSAYEACAPSEAAGADREEQDQSPSGPQPVDAAEVNRQRARFADAVGDDYDATLVVRCLCPHSPTPVRIEVRDDVITRATALPRDAEPEDVTDRLDERNVRTIRELHVLLAEVAGRAGSVVRATYDDRGVPLVAELDPRVDAVDDEVTYVLRDLVER